MTSTTRLTRLTRLAVGLLAALPAISTSAVYRCQAGDEPPHFSQFPCGGGAPMALESLQIVELPPISDAQRATLAELERARREAAAERARVRAKSLDAASRERRERRRRCEALQAELDALSRQRRKGYSLSEARDLDRREAALNRDARRYC
jgi:hypothetical protein